MKKRIVWYASIYFIISFLVGIIFSVYNRLYLSNVIRRENGLIDEPILLNHIATVTLPTFLSKLAIFFIIPLFIFMYDKSFKKLLVIYASFIPIVIIGELCFGFILPGVLLNILSIFIPGLKV